MRRTQPQTHTSVLHPPAAGALDEAILKSLDAAREYLFSIQQPDGHWVGELEGDTILESEYALLRYFMGCLDEDRLRKLANYLRQKQRPEGGWASFPGGGVEVSGSVKAYLVLKLAGLSADHPEMVRAREAILAHGGVTACNTFTKIYLAIFGQYDWDGTPVVPPELALLPSWFYLNLNEISSWSRAIVVPLAIIVAHRPHCPLPVSIDELFIGGRHGRHLRLQPAGNPFTWRNFFLGIDRCLHFFEDRKILPWRKKALKACEQWMVARFRKSGGLGAIFPPIVNALMAMRLLGYPDDHPEVLGQWREIEAFEIEEGDTLRLQPCVSPVWDTALSTMALSAAGTAPDDPAMVRAGEWLLERRIREKGDWAVKRPDAPVAAWFFEYANEFYPDVDDTAAVLMALESVRLPNDAEKRAICSQAVEWVFAMQGQDGGWASFDVDNNRMIFAQIPFADHNAMLDPSTSDITARTLEMLARYGYDRSEPRVQRAIAFIQQDQEHDGAWFGRWGVNYIYGTWQVLKGLSVIGEDMDQPYIQKAAQWLRDHQNEDGGWGESCQTYDDPSLRGKGPSTASQTAWALMGLMSAGDVSSE
ncbi:MAG TPA: squalene--hopene cyclase, partial [Armatimonadota bacterium]|nr:squalene--hopene cyclase [Armatimonadota bacterium]